jgi:hypothetical protein
MLHQLANLPDNELMARARKLKDEEAAGILLERYSHLLAAVSLPSLDNYANTPDEFFPSLVQRLFKSLQTQTIPKIGEWMHFFLKSHSSRDTRNSYYFPSTASSDITRLEYKVEKANSTLVQKQQLSAAMDAAFDQLHPDDRDLLTEFYIEQKTFAEISAESGYPIEEIRKYLKQAKQELASLALENLESGRSRRPVQGYTTIVKQEEGATVEFVPAEIESIYDIQEQGTILEYPQSENQVYAKFGNQGQDIKDLQQGSLF